MTDTSLVQLHNTMEVQLAIQEIAFDHAFDINLAMSVLPDIWSFIKGNLYLVFFRSLKKT